MPLPSPNTGLLRQRITFQTPAPGVDSQGWPNSGYADYVTVWAQVTGGSATRVNGKEMVGADTVLSENLLSVTIRYREDITPDMRVVYRSLPYVIVALADKDGLRTWLNLEIKGWQSGGR